MLSHERILWARARERGELVGPRDEKHTPMGTFPGIGEELPRLFRFASDPSSLFGS